MSKYYLRKWNDPILRTPCKKVEDFSGLDGFILYMNLMMDNYGGLGLAAPQVGVDRQILVAKINHSSRVFINPKIASAGGYIPYVEGCLSLPGLFVPTLRRYRIDIEYQDIHGNPQKETFRGLSSIVLQHEIDHLNGKLMYHYF